MSLVEEMHQRLNFEVNDKASICVIEATKTVFDLTTLSSKAIKTVPRDILQEQYKEFLKRLEKLTAAYTSEQLKCLKVSHKEIFRLK